MQHLERGGCGMECHGLAGPSSNADLDGRIKCSTAAGKRGSGSSSATPCAAAAGWAGMECLGASTRLLLQQGVHICRMFTIAIGSANTGAFDYFLRNAAHPHAGRRAAGRGRRCCALSPAAGPCLWPAGTGAARR